MRVISCPQGTPEWFAARHKCVTASRFKVVCSGTVRGQQTYLDELRAPEPKEQVRAKSLQWGKYHEPQARAMYELTYAVDTETVGFVLHATEDHVGCSPDALIKGAPGGLEIKCPYSPEVHSKTIRRGMPKEHHYQVQGCIWLCEAQYWDFVSFCPSYPDPTARLFVQRIWRDDKFIEGMARKVLWFRDLLLSGAEVPDPQLKPEDVIFGGLPLASYIKGTNHE